MKYRLEKRVYTDKVSYVITKFVDPKWIPLYTTSDFNYAEDLFNCYIGVPKVYILREEVGE